MTRTHFWDSGPIRKQPRERLLELEFHFIPKQAPCKSGFPMTTRVGG